MTTFDYNPEDANPLVPDGEYDAVILTAKKGETKKGDPKLEIVIKVYGPDGVSPLVTDNIVAPYGIRRLRQLCAATGEDFDSGEVDPTAFVGRNIRARTRIKKDETGEYDDQNVIRAYLPDNGGAAEANPQPAGNIESSPATERTTVPVSSTSESTKPPQVGKREAWSVYCEAVRADRSDVSEELLAKNFKTIITELIGKPEGQLTEADWIKVRDEGPKEFIPF